MDSEAAATDSTEAGQRPGPRPAVFSAMLGTSVAVLPVFLVGALAALMRRDFALTSAQLGQVMSLFFLTSALASVPAGRIADRVNPYRNLVVTSLATSVALLVVAGAVHGFRALLVVMALAGVANAFAQPGTNILIAKFVPTGRRASAFGLKQAAVPSALLIGGASVPALAVANGWRSVFVATSVGCAVSALLIARWAGVDGLPQAESTADGRPESTGAAPGPPVLPLAVLAAGGGFAAAATNSLGGFYVDFVALNGVPVDTAGTMLAAGSLAAIVVRVVWGWWADHHPVGMRMIVRLLMVGAVGFVLLGATTSLPVIGLATVLAFGAGWGWNGLFHYSVTERHPSAGASTGVTTAGLFLGGVLGPAMFGFIADHGSYALAWKCAGAALVIAALLVLLGRKLWPLAPVAP